MIIFTYNQKKILQEPSSYLPLPILKILNHSNFLHFLLSFKNISFLWDHLVAVKLSPKSYLTCNL